MTTRHFYAIEFFAVRDAVTPKFPLDILVHRYDRVVNRDDRVSLERNRTPLASRWRKLPARHAAALKAEAKAAATDFAWPITVTIDTEEEMGAKP